MINKMELNLKLHFPLTPAEVEILELLILSYKIPPVRLEPLPVTPPLQKKIRKQRVTKIKPQQAFSNLKFKNDTSSEDMLEEEY